MSDLSDHAEYDGNVIWVDVSEMEYETIAIPATPNGELRELVEQWRNHTNPAEVSETVLTNEFADELEELINE